MADRKNEVRKRVRLRLAREQRGKCYYCGCQMILTEGRADGVNHPRQATLDHLKPLSQGGARGPTLNAVAACLQCNGERGDKDARLFMLEKMGQLA